MEVNNKLEWIITNDFIVSLKKTESWSYSVDFWKKDNIKNITKNLKLILHNNEEQLKNIFEWMITKLILTYWENSNEKEIEKTIIPTFMNLYNSEFKIDEWIDIESDNEEFELDSWNEWIKNIKTIYWKFKKEKEIWINKWDKILLLLQWVPWCWKSTWIKENWLEQFTLSTDEYRLRYWKVELDINWNEWISQESNKIVFRKLFEDIEQRMANSLFTIIDATHLTEKSIKSYEDLVNKFWYQVMIKKFDISLEEAIERNKNRWFRNISEDVVRNMYENQQKLWEIEWITYIDNSWDLPNDTLSLNNVSNKYEKIYYIWDIQWCSLELKKFLDQYYNEKNLYIFVWDLVDRWYDDAWVLKLILDIVDNENVILIKWNHDVHLERYYNEWMKQNVWSKVFDEITRKRIDKKFNQEWWLTSDELWKIVNKFVLSTYHEIWWKRIFACHWGIPKLTKNIWEKQLIRWVWQYDEHQLVDESFEKWALENKESQYYSVHWHRNSLNVSIKSTNRTFNLEWKIEFWWELRVVSFDTKWKNDFILIESSTKKQNWEEVTLKERFTWNRMIDVKTLDDWIFSVNFTRDAFNSRLWNNQTMKARWLFIWNKNQIYARSYNKFFNIWERPETQKEIVWETIWFPIQVYHKYNWFLWIVWMKDWKVRYFSKSSDKWKFAELVKKHIEKYENKLKILLNWEFTAVFEICDKTDEHIVREEERPILLDIIHNDINEFKKKSYKELQLIWKALWIETKKFIKTLNNNEELQNFLKEIENDKIEWYILEWTKWMTKTKSKHYLFWKEIRADIFSRLKKILNRDYKATQWIKNEYINAWTSHQKESDEYIQKLNELFLNRVTENDLIELKHSLVISMFKDKWIWLFSYSIPDLIEISKNLWIKEIPKWFNDWENIEH